MLHTANMTSFEITFIMIYSLCDFHRANYIIIYFILLFYVNYIIIILYILYYYIIYIHKAIILSEIQKYYRMVTRFDVADNKYDFI